MKNRLHTLLAFTALTSVAVAAPQTFDFKDPKGVNHVVFKTDAILESIGGSANGVSGTVTFDPENPTATKGKIIVKAETLTVQNSMMQGHMHGPQWLDVKQFPEITFEAKSLKNVKTSADATTADVTGDFSLHGVTNEITVPVKLSYLKDRLQERVPNMKGDLLVIRSDFKIKRGDYGINPGQFEDKVSDEIELTLSIAGAAAK